MLAVAASSGDVERFDLVLTGYAESDYRPRPDPTGVSFGVFQQKPEYWPASAHGSTTVQARAFLVDYRANRSMHNPTDAVQRCWLTQRWSIPGSRWPDLGPNYQAERRRVGSQTWNYVRRLELIDGMIRSGRVPTIPG